MLNEKHECNSRLFSLKTEGIKVKNITSYHLPGINSYQRIIFCKIFIPSRLVGMSGDVGTAHLHILKLSHLQIAQSSSRYLPARMNRSDVIQAGLSEHPIFKSSNFHIFKSSHLQIFKSILAPPSPLHPSPKGRAIRCNLFSPALYPQRKKDFRCYPWRKQPVQFCLSLPPAPFKQPQLRRSGILVEDIHSNIPSSVGATYW